MPDLPTGTGTFLFTFANIVGSTAQRSSCTNRRYGKDPDEMRHVSRIQAKRRFSSALRSQGQLAAAPLDDVLALIVVKVLLAPETGRVPHNLRNL